MNLIMHPLKQISGENQAELVQSHVQYSVESFMGLHAAFEMPATQPYWEGHTCHQYCRAEILCAVQNLLLMLN